MQNRLKSTIIKQAKQIRCNGLLIGGQMKNFFKQYSYSIIKMFVNQFAISIFGCLLAMAAAAAGNNILMVVVSIFAIVFYLFLIYTMTWEIGATDRISVDVGKKPYRPHTGLWLSLVANIPNFLIAVIYTIGYPFMATQKWAGNICSLMRVGALLLEGMYRGLTSVITLPSGNALWHAWWSYFLIIIPAIVTSWLAYFLGFKNFRFVAQYFNKTPNQGNKK